MKVKDKWKDNGLLFICNKNIKEESTKGITCFRCRSHWENHEL